MSDYSSNPVLFWHRRDLRVCDNQGLYTALKSGRPVIPIFIFDRNILDDLEDRDDARVTFIHDHVVGLNELYAAHGATLRVEYGNPEELIPSLAQEYGASAVYTNRDYEPYAVARDAQIQHDLEFVGATLHTFKDQCIFERDEVVKKDGGWYSVFTPYSRVWKADYEVNPPQMVHSEELLHHCLPQPLREVLSLEEMGFARSNKVFPSHEVDSEIIENYHLKRDIPSVRGTTRLSVHLRFGTVSIRELAAHAWRTNEKFLNELIWRDFYMMILHHNPHVVKGSFRPEYDRIEWENDPVKFEAWCAGKTGYPLVDAGMRELNATGFMHNRLRMVVSSFLVKHLGIDWRLGEAYFARKLLDFELSSNNGGWQWAAGSGCDAAPYFRVFNPELQMKKFDPDLIYVKKWVPEFQDFTVYPAPIVDHKVARVTAVERYKKALAR